MVHFKSVLLTLLLGLQPVDDKTVSVFVNGANAHQSEWLELVSANERNGRDAVDFCNLSGCEQLVHCPTHSPGNRLDLVMTDVPDIVDMVVSTQLGTSDHCFVSCVLRVAQPVPEYNVRSTVFLKHCTNSDSIRGAVRSFTWSTILKSADLLVELDPVIGKGVGMFLQLFCVIDLETSTGLMSASREPVILNRLLIVPGVEHAMLNIGVNLCLLVQRHKGSHQEYSGALHLFA